MIRCNRCREPFGDRKDFKCDYCGVHRDRVVKRIRRRASIGGKRGRNSGTTNKSKV